MKMKFYNSVYFGAVAIGVTSVYMLLLFPESSMGKAFAALAFFILSYVWLSYVWHVGKLGKMIQKEIVDEDDAYRESLKPTPPWKRPPPEE